MAILDDAIRVRRLDTRTLHAGQATWLQLRLENGSGEPMADLEPHMGMAAHLAVFRQDFSVFAHLHPDGSPPIVTVELANGSAMVHPMGHHHQMVSPELTFPYGFPKGGIYRLFVQFKLGARWRQQSSMRVAGAPANLNGPLPIPPK